MANFSTKERLIASLLSSTPGLKSHIKAIYIRLNALLYHKKYKSLVLDSRITKIHQISLSNEKETFFGYYDKCPMNENDWIIVNESPIPTRLKPSADEPIQIGLINLKTNEYHSIGESFSYTWQQGARAQWIDNDKLIYNCFRNGNYCAIIYSLKEKKEIKQYPYPVQDSYKDNYFLSINYRRIMNLRPDYGYRNIPPMNREEMEDLKHDGIWMVDYKSGNSTLLHSLQDIIECGYKSEFANAQHKVNHLMINEKGNCFIFIHRYYLGKRRFDRLMYSDFKSIKLLIDNEMVSHCCWINPHTFFGYLRYQGKNGFYLYSTDENKVFFCSEATNYNMGDGHPSCWKDWIVFDSYPDKSRMQHLTLYNIRTRKIVPLLELHHKIAYKGQSRCDLHPRFSNDGASIFFDSVYKGKRHLHFIDVSEITKS